MTHGNAVKYATAEALAPASVFSQAECNPSELRTMEATGMDEYMRTNLENWESRVPVHTGAGGYDLQRFVDDPNALSDVVASMPPILEISLGCMWCTFSATSARTRCRWPVLARM